MLHAPRRAAAIAIAAAAGLALVAAPAWAKKGGKHQHKHEHGAAELSIAVDGDSVAVALQVPADGIFGFEHMPRTEAQKKVVADAMALLRGKPLELFVLDAAKGCEVTETDVEAAQEAAAVDAKAKDAHAEVLGDWTFKCKAPLAGTELKLGLMEKFPRIKKVTVQILSGTSQSGKTVKSAKDALKL